MEHYVTLFDSLFLPQGLALHMSMERHVKDYTLWIICVNDETYEVLTRLSLLNVRLLQLSQLETKELLRVKPIRSKGEYCWTLTPFAPRFVFEADEEVKRVTYLDADLWFRMSPEPIFNELKYSQKSILITDHAYSPKYDQSNVSGRYCVQYITFSRDIPAEKVRVWWEDRCIEWCFARFEDGKFGDQKYLDQWPKLFSNHVHILIEKSFTQAPWNTDRFKYEAAIFYHFHGLRIEIKKKGNVIVHLFNYRIPRDFIKNIYEPYLCDLRKSISLLNEKTDFRIKSQMQITTAQKFTSYIIGILRESRNITTLKVIS